jgi:chemotaxis signal transduction protein
MFNQRGNAVPVFDLSPLFDHEPKEEACAYMLITDSGERAAGLVVDGLPAVLTCEPSEMPQLANLPPVIAQTVRATYTAAGQEWYEVDHLALFRLITQEVLD